jgi:hypothetical protein
MKVGISCLVKDFLCSVLHNKCASFVELHIFHISLKVKIPLIWGDQVKPIIGHCRAYCWGFWGSSHHLYAARFTICTGVCDWRHDVCSSGRGNSRNATRKIHRHCRAGVYWWLCNYDDSGRSTGLNYFEFIQKRRPPLCVATASYPMTYMTKIR